MLFPIYVVFSEAQLIVFLTLASGYLLYLFVLATHWDRTLLFLDTILQYM